MILVTLAAMLPLAALSIIQGSAAWRDSRALVANQLRANAVAIAEGEREPFVIARHAMTMLGHDRLVREGGSGCREMLTQAQQTTAGIINFVRADESGTVRCSALPFLPGQSFADQRWWQDGIKSSGFTLSNPTIGQISQKRVLILMVPLHNEDGTHDGAVTSSIGLDALQASIERRGNADPDALIAIIGARGNIILRNRSTTIRTFDPAEKPGDLATIKDSDGHEWVFATAAFQGKNLCVVYAKPRQNLLRTGLWQVRQSLILPLLAMVLATLAIWVGTHWLVVRWLKGLQSLAVQFGKGDFAGDRAAYVGAPYEIAALSDELHAMASTIEQRDAALTSALAAKSALTREVHHRVKNNLQIVTSLLTLQTDRIEDAWAREVLGQAKARMAALGLIHRLLYQSDHDNEMGTVNMRLLVGELCAQIRAAHRARTDVDLHCDCAEFELSVDQAVPLTLFIVEGVTNAFRHAFSDARGGRITLHMIVIDKVAELSIRDDGRGYSVGQAVAKMGTELMNAFSTQLGGSLEVTSDAQGTRVSLRYPLDPHA